MHSFLKAAKSITWILKENHVKEWNNLKTDFELKFKDDVNYSKLVKLIDWNIDAFSKNWISDFVKSFRKSNSIDSQSLWNTNLSERSLKSLYFPDLANIVLSVYAGQAPYDFNFKRIKKIIDKMISDNVETGLVGKYSWFNDILIFARKSVEVGLIKPEDGYSVTNNFFEKPWIESWNALILFLLAIFEHWNESFGKNASKVLTEALVANEKNKNIGYELRIADFKKIVMKFRKKLYPYTNLLIIN